jgi:hypothetical protein
MLQRSGSHHTAVTRLLVTAGFIILGWAYLHSSLRNRHATGSSALSIDYTFPALGGGSSAALDCEDTPLDPSTPQDEHGARPASHHATGRGFEVESGRRQAFTMFTALLMQFQSAGSGAK